MSDARDAVVKALALNRQLAASKLTRKQELEVELTALRRERAATEGEAPELDAQLEALSGELAQTDAELRAAMAELDELRRLAGGIDVGVARALAGADADPLIQSPEEAALERARGHIAELDATARLGSELGEDAAPVREPMSRDEADAQARAAFEELRSQRGQPGESPRPPSKKTL